jgi:hypothetical protein
LETTEWFQLATYISGTEDRFAERWQHVQRSDQRLDPLRRENHFTSESNKPHPN